MLPYISTNSILLLNFRQKVHHFKLRIYINNTRNKAARTSIITNSLEFQSFTKRFLTKGIFAYTKLNYVVAAFLSASRSACAQR